ncbi:MAG TPA: hypothetical protein VJT54_03670, partial [Verrucomicrobiae bacterium]|nr:hypothetical protein [Verrucomicrobiae bacterium]
QNRVRRLLDCPCPKTITRYWTCHYIMRISIDYSDIRALGLMSHLPQVKLAVQWLEVSEYYNLHRNKPDAACTDVRAMLALIKGETQERYEISQLVRFALVQMSASATWDILQTTNISDESLTELQRDWQLLKITASLKSSFLFERANELRLLNNFRQSPTNLSWWLGSVFIQKGYDYEQTGEGTSARWVLVDKSPPFKRLMNRISIPWDEMQWRWFWSYRDELQALQMWGIVLDGTQELETNNSFLSVQSFVNTNFARLDPVSARKNPYEIASQTALTQLTAIRKAAAAEVARNVVITAIAIKRYQIRHDQLPDSLAQLVPYFLQSVPMDYMDGQPLRYRRNADGTFLLYSIGENGKDDGGNPALEQGVESSNYYWQNPHALDWVWPQPATPEEIQAYYARQKSGN